MVQIVGSFPMTSSIKQTGRGADMSSAGDVRQGFQDVLKQTIAQTDASQTHTLRFSKHANARLADRNITLTPAQVDRLQEGVLQAREKGIRESLVMMDNLSFIVNVKNETVVTALDTQSSDKNIFTNIDGAVIV